MRTFLSHIFSFFVQCIFTRWCLCRLSRGMENQGTCSLPLHYLHASWPTQDTRRAFLWSPACGRAKQNSARLATRFCAIYLPQQCQGCQVMLSSSVAYALRTTAITIYVFSNPQPTLRSWIPQLYHVCAILSHSVFLPPK